MNKPCQHCPFRSNIKPFLHPERAIEIANADSFPCHKTVDYDDDGDGCLTNNSIECIGFEIINGFRPKQSCVYSTKSKMFSAYQKAWKH